MMMKHKEVKMIVLALVSSGLLYFGIQHYYNNGCCDNVKIQSSGGMKSKLAEKMKEKMEEKMHGGQQ